MDNYFLLTLKEMPKDIDSLTCGCYTTIEKALRNFQDEEVFEESGFHLVPFRTTDHAHPELIDQPLYPGYVLKRAYVIMTVTDDFDTETGEHFVRGQPTEVMNSLEWCENGRKSDVFDRSECPTHRLYCQSFISEDHVRKIAADAWENWKKMEALGGRGPCEHGH